MSAAFRATMEFSPDGKYLVLTTAFDGFEVWNTDNWSRRKVGVGPALAWQYFTFSSDSRYLIATRAGDIKSNLTVWSLSDGRLVQYIAQDSVGKPVKTIDGGVRYESVSFDPKGRFFGVVVPEEQQIWFFELK